MKKVIMAVLMAASKEGIQCVVSISSNGSVIETNGSLKMADNHPADRVSLQLWRGGSESNLTLSPDESTELSVNTTDGKYEIGIGGVCITFQEKFQRDPFTVTPNA